MLFLRPLEDRTPRDLELDPIPHATLWAGLDCMAWRVDRLRSLLHGLLGDRGDARCNEVIELADDLERLVGDARRILARPQGHEASD
jgi:hypothetical protein